MKNLIYIGLLGLIFTACNSYLDEAPSKSTNLPLQNIEQLDALLGNYYYFFSERSRTSVLSTEDWALTEELYNGINASLFSSMEVVQNATWDIEYTPFDGDDSLWESEYKKIFYANMVLHYLDEVEGSTDQKEAIKAEAYLIKAYSYWVLANNYCLPYSDETKNEPGITIKNSVSFEEPLERKSLEDTYREIERCVGESLNSNIDLGQGMDYMPWRGSISAARAFAARFYLSIGDYQNAKNML